MDPFDRYRSYLNQIVEAQKIADEINQQQASQGTGILSNPVINTAITPSRTEEDEGIMSLADTTNVGSVTKGVPGSVSYTDVLGFVTNPVGFTANKALGAVFGKTPTEKLSEVIRGAVAQATRGGYDSVTSGDTTAGTAADPSTMASEDPSAMGGDADSTAGTAADPSTAASEDPSAMGGDSDSGSSGNSKIVCTMMNESYGFGSFRNKIWMKFHKDLSPEYQKGYHKIFLPLVKRAKTNKIIKNILEHIAVHSTIDMRQSMRGKTHILGKIYRKILLPICYLVGKF